MKKNYFIIDDDIIGIDEGINTDLVLQGVTRLTDEQALFYKQFPEASITEVLNRRLSTDKVKEEKR